MSRFEFDKYQGTGNDFVIFDGIKNSNVIDKLTTEKIAQICDRKFGVGADGLMLVLAEDKYDFRMKYFNADGAEGSFCGNGSRCIVHFAHVRSYCQNSVDFVAYDGAHEAQVGESHVSIKMSNVLHWQIGQGFYVMDTGSPHYITFVEDISDLDIPAQGKAIRYASAFAKEGINVNFVEQKKSGIKVATYERGVEDETLSCGTGVVASSIAYSLRKQFFGQQEIQVFTKGGALTVQFRLLENRCTDIYLKGPAVQVFSGIIDL